MAETTLKKHGADHVHDEEWEVTWCAKDAAELSCLQEEGEPFTVRCLRRLPDLHGVVDPISKAVHYFTGRAEAEDYGKARLRAARKSHG